MKKILLVTRHNPYLTRGGDTRRVLSYIEALCSRGNSVTVVCFGKSDLNTTNGSVIVSQVGWSFVSAILGCIWALKSGHAFQTGLFKQPKLLAKIRHYLTLNPVDQGICHLVRFGFCIESFPDLSWILEMTDAISMNYSRDDGSSSLVQAIIRKVETQRLVRDEIFYGNLADSVVVISPIDREWLIDRGLNGEKVKVLLNYTHRPIVQKRSPKKEFAFAFVGKLSTYPNRQAVNFILEQLVKDLRYQKFGLKVRIVGSSVPDKLRQRITEQSSIDLVDSPADILSQLGDCQIGLCPIVAAAGLQNKIIDYVSSGLPVIASKECALPFHAVVPSTTNYIHICDPLDAASIIDLYFEIAEQSITETEFQQFLEPFSIEAFTESVFGILDKTTSTGTISSTILPPRGRT